MKPFWRKLFAALIFIAPLGLGIETSNAQFEKSDGKLFLGWLDLAINPEPGTDHGAYAIVQPGGENLPVIYVIFSNFKGKVIVLGSFRCDVEFKVLNSDTGGMRDIRCVLQDVFGQKKTTILRYGEKGLYVQRF